MVRTESSGPRTPPVEVAAVFREVLAEDQVRTADEIGEAYGHDETLSAQPCLPAAVLLPGSTHDVAAILEVADRWSIPVTARGAGTGLSGAAIADHDGIVVSFERMDRISEIDLDNGVAVVEPGVRLADLDAALAPLGLVYPVRPGEDSATIGGTVNTNAAGMRAVRYGATRNHVLGLEFVLAGGQVIRSGGKVVKRSSGYDLAQLVIGSEGTLALVTRVWLKLAPRPRNVTTLLAPFTDLEQITGAVPRILASGLAPLVLEYLDALTMAAIVHRSGLELGVTDATREAATAYLVVQLADDHADRVEQDMLALGELLVDELGAMDALVLPGQAATDLITAREQAFYAAREVGFHDIIDVVVPRAALPAYARRVGRIAEEFSAGIVGCGHAGDGNVHMSVFEPDEQRRAQVMAALLEAGVELGGEISGEHGIGRHKKPWFEALTDPAALQLMRGMKAAFDPRGILNPGAIFDLPRSST
ncbi:MAG TPA: FAD-linked oxidase C-terminal domain-containing protein [Egicoccus sp.]|nr:FAD-linked oxidase C-terminal domain-containing protein [Egicoccus sp.]HSK22143.1 FAD-linked oxidase C-terminal domain-containing protein [Egicoccus sp.]